MEGCILVLLIRAEFCPQPTRSTAKLSVACCALRCAALPWPVSQHGACAERSAPAHPLRILFFSFRPGRTRTAKRGTRQLVLYFYYIIPDATRASARTAGKYKHCRAIVCK